MTGTPTITYRDRTIIAPKIISADDFDSLDSFGRLADEQGLSLIVVTPRAWSKYESFLFSLDELQNMVTGAK